MALVPMMTLAQGSGGQVTRPVNNPQSVSTNKNNQKNKEKRSTSVEPKLPKEDQKSAGYDVEFVCSTPESSIEIDGAFYSKASGTRFLKEGEHHILLKAEGFEEHQETIYVDSSSKKFVISMTPIKEAAGYDVSFDCNVPTAKLYIAGALYESKKESVFLKTGSHSIKCEADGYESLTKTIEVNSNSKKFSFKLKEKESHLPPILQNLINNMVYVEGGTFMMGATYDQGEKVKKSEKPAHLVTLSSFNINKYEVTSEEWLAVMENDTIHKLSSNMPVTNVSWDDCQLFILRLNALTGKMFRLPTEAEWEFAARGGTKSRGYKYSGSNNIKEVAWYEKNSQSGPKPVGQLSPNELGLYDMSGNVWEWCNDIYGSYKLSSLKNPSGASSGKERVIRGASRSEKENDCRVSLRNSSEPEHRTPFLGFRLAY